MEAVICSLLCSVVERDQVIRPRVAPVNTTDAQKDTRPFWDGGRRLAGTPRNMHYTDMTDMTPEADVGRMLKKARKRAGVSLRSMAAALDTNHSEVAKIERGRPSTLARYARIADLLGCDLIVRVKRRAA
jgi:ribosome-binding protein aMBF1 (putative translation factor)